MKTYDVVFNDNENSNCKCFASSKEEAINYIRTYNGTNESYFADYKGGIVQVMCNETSEAVFQQEVI